MRVAIHQPNFMPWLPFLDKLASVDVFVVMSQCQFDRRGYQSRFMQDGQWHSMSVLNKREPICMKRYLDPEYHWKVIKKQLPGFLRELVFFDACVSESLLEMNRGILLRAVGLFGIKTKIVDDFPSELTGTSRLVDLCKTHGATTYVSGMGAKDYMEMELFEEAGIAVEFLNPPEDRKLSLIQAMKSGVSIC